MILLLLYLDGLGGGLTHRISARPDHGGQVFPMRRSSSFDFAAGVPVYWRTILKVSEGNIKAQTLSGTCST